MSIQHRFSKIAVATVGAVATLGTFASVTHAANLGGYTFDAQPGFPNGSPVATNVDPGLSFTDFSSSGVTNFNFIAGNNPPGRAISAQDWSASFDLSKYFTFTISPLPTTSSFSITSFGLDARRGGNGPQSIQVRTSLDSYANPIATFLNVDNNSWTSYSASSLNLGPLSSPINFRIYGYDGTGTSGNNSQLSLDNVSVHGSVVPVPTPALLPGLVGLGAGVLRKRKQQREVVTA
jgi:hypothetical protein